MVGTSGAEEVRGRIVGLEDVGWLFFIGGPSYWTGLCRSVGFFWRDNFHFNPTSYILNGLFIII